MSWKRGAASILLVLAAVLLNIAVIRYRVPDKEYELTVNVTLNFDRENGIQLYYLTGNQTVRDGFQENKMVAAEYQKVGQEQTLSYAIPADVRYLRLDIGAGSSEGYLSELTVSSGKTEKTLPPDQVSQVFQTHQATVFGENGRLMIQTEGEDPYLVWDVSGWGIEQILQQAHARFVFVCKVLLCLVFDSIFIYLVLFWRKSMMIPKELWQDRKLILRLAKNDFKTKFAGSYLGIIWAFIQPIVTILVYWFVFQKGLKASGINTSAGITIPFVLWLVAGLVPWFFFSDALSGGTNALIEYSYLVKKVVFKISILPIVKVLSALFVHLFFIVFTLCLYSAYRYFPDGYTLQVIYYTFCMFVLTLGISYITCALVSFFRDLTQIINIVLQVGVWMTPIMWNIETMDLPVILLKIFKLNPMYYVVAGYRDALINKVWFWDNPSMTIYFWIFTAVVFVLGMRIFKRLKVHFADVL